MNGQIPAPAALPPTIEPNLPNMRLGESRNLSGRRVGGGGGNHMPLPRIENRVLCRPVRSFDCTQTELPGLIIMKHYIIIPCILAPNSEKACHPVWPNCKRLQQLRLAPSPQIARSQLSAKLRNSYFVFAVTQQQTQNAHPPFALNKLLNFVK